MPPPEVQNLNQRAALWVASTLDRHGRFTLLSVVEIAVRWEGGEQEGGRPQSTSAPEDVTAFVDRVITIGSIMRYGTVAALPTSPDKLFKVTGYTGMPDIKGRIYQRSVTLTKYGDTLPTVAS